MGRVVVIHTFNLSTGKVEAGRFQLIQDQFGLQNEFHGSQDCNTQKPCLKNKIKTNRQTKCKKVKHGIEHQDSSAKMMGLLAAPPHPLNLFLLSRVIFTSFPPKCSMTVRCKSFPSSVISLVRNVKRLLICSTKNLSISHLSVFLVCLSISQSSIYLSLCLSPSPSLPLPFHQCSSQSQTLSSQGGNLD